MDRYVTIMGRRIQNQPKKLGPPYQIAHRCCRVGILECILNNSSTFCSNLDVKALNCTEILLLVFKSAIQINSDKYNTNYDYYQ